MPEDKKTKKMHNLIMENRAQLTVSGVEDVDSFDEEQVVLFTDYGELTIKGDNLHINKLSIENGEVSVEGDIFALTYSDTEPAAGSGFLSRLFK